MDHFAFDYFIISCTFTSAILLAVEYDGMPAVEQVRVQGSYGGEGPGFICQKELETREGEVLPHQPVSAW